ncbi:MAG: SufB/SufD family protein [Candidatus Levyibacteriota bacterium]
MMKNIIIKKDEEKILPVVWTGGEEHIDYKILLSQPGASIILLMLFLGKKQHAGLVNVSVIHDSPQTKSKVLVKGILEDSASIDFNGLVKIQEKAKGSQAWLGAHLLLLSESAKGRAVPSLEILENDVKAGHATTVGRINDNQVFYLMSRGLSKKQARKLIIEGFVQQFLAEFPEEERKKARRELM